MLVNNRILQNLYFLNFILKILIPYLLSLKLKHILYFFRLLMPSNNNM